MLQGKAGIWSKLSTRGLERGLACHPERSEGSLRPTREILRCAQDDRPSLQMSARKGRAFSKSDPGQAKSATDASGEMV